MSDYAIIIAARMASERLSGKALVSYCPDSTPNLQQIIARWRQSRRQPAIAVATTTGSEDDAIADLCGTLDVPIRRGSPTDVVSSVDGTLREFAPNARFIARGLGDNPLVDVGLADWRLDVLAETGADGLWYGGDEARLTYAATTDVWRREAWDRIVDGSSGSQREHPGAFFWDNMSKFSVVQLQLPPREYIAPVRTELDTPRDLEMLRQLWKLWYEQFNPKCQIPSPQMPSLWALDTLCQHPEIAAINAEVRVKTQTKALWRKGLNWLCEGCQRRMAGIVAGDLEVRCARCGKPRKWYSQKPKPSMGRY